MESFQKMNGNQFKNLISKYNVQLIKMYKQQIQIFRTIDDSRK